MLIIPIRGTLSIVTDSSGVLPPIFWRGNYQLGDNRWKTSPLNPRFQRSLIILPYLMICVCAFEKNYVVFWIIDVRRKSSQVFIQKQVELAAKLQRIVRNGVKLAEECSSATTFFLWRTESRLLVKSLCVPRNARRNIFNIKNLYNTLHNGCTVQFVHFCIYC